MINLVPTNLNINFMKYRFVLFGVSIVVSLLAVAAIVTKGFRFGVDFRGGVEAVLKFDGDVSIEQLRASLDRMGLKDASVQTFGTQFETNKNEFIVHFSGDFADQEAVQAALDRELSRVSQKANVLANYRFSGLEKGYLQLKEKLPQDQIESAVRAVDFAPLEVLEVNPFGRETSLEYQVIFRGVGSFLQTELAKDLPGRQMSIQRLDFVGAKVGADLKLSAILSIVITILLVFVYVFMRFELKYAPGVVVALGHDVLIVAGLFAYFEMDFDLTIVAALLTLAGYSINDTIVIYDRIREVAANLKGKAFSDIINVAVNQTLGRTIMTGITTMMATIVLWIYGGPVIHGFAFALTVGIVVGTYSSVFIAAPLILWMNEWMGGTSEVKRGKRVAA